MNIHKMDLLSNLTSTYWLTHLFVHPKNLNRTFELNKTNLKKGSVFCLLSSIVKATHLDGTIQSFFGMAPITHLSMLINTCTTNSDVKLQLTMTLLETLMATKEILGGSTLFRDDYWSKPNQHERLHRKVHELCNYGVPLTMVLWIVDILVKLDSFLWLGGCTLRRDWRSKPN